MLDVGSAKMPTDDRRVDPSAVPPENQDTQALLRDIIYELKNIGICLSQQNNRIETITSPNVLDTESISQPVVNSTLPETSMSSMFDGSTEKRIGPILQEALTRYRHNTVPFWSCLYGVYLVPAVGPDLPEEVTRNREWKALIGDFWRIPHDNRLNLCFRAPLDDIAAVVRVRNFVSHYHRPEHSDSPKDEHFNIRDWFDTGISEYWYPGKKATAFPLDSLNWSRESVQHSGNSCRLSTMIAPWRRIINFEGLTSLSGDDFPTNQEDLTDQDLCPFIAKTNQSIFQEPMDEILWKVVKSHLRCLRVSEIEHAAMQTKGWALFHVTFYEILKCSQNRTTTELWPSGQLHSDYQQHLGYPRRVRESALTRFPASIFPVRGLELYFGQMMCMRPHLFPHLCYSENRDDLTRGRTHEMLDDMSDLVHRSLQIVISRWEEIADYFESLLCEKIALMNPSYHDSLLTDDGAFTRSKKYFWAIEFLKEAETSVLDNIGQVEQFINLLVTNPPATRVARMVFEMRLRKHHTTLKKLDALSKRFGHKRDEAKALRDGLFSASAVIESRAATQLGENIKLLTYVSVFFLPLSFCMSIWSINDNLFSLSSLAAVVPIVSITTYTIVLNLNHITLFFLPHYTRTASSILGHLINSLVRNMQNDRTSIWRERGAAFKRFKTVQGCNSQPSQWRILQFALRQAIFGILCAFTRLNPLKSKILRSWMQGRPTTEEKIHALNLSGNIGDVHVEIQVNVDVEAAEELQNID